jgi:hypothetical protein
MRMVVAVVAAANHGVFAVLADGRAVSNPEFAYHRIT